MHGLRSLTDSWSNVSMNSNILKEDCGTELVVPDEREDE